MSEYTVILEHGEDGAWGAFLPDPSGVFALGESRLDVEERMREAIGAALEFDREQELGPAILAAASPNDVAVAASLSQARCDAPQSTFEAVVLSVPFVARVDAAPD